MKKLLVLDSRNYPEGMEEIRRVAVRGIIFLHGKLLLIQSNFGELKFPGGGQEDGEDDLQTLIRETLEETGYHVLPHSICPFGEVEEKRLSVHGPKIWHQLSRYYFCDVSENQGACHYTESEKEYGFRQVFYTLDEAIAINESVLDKEGVQPWNQREYRVLKLIREHLNTHEVKQ